MIRKLQQGLKLEMPHSRPMPSIGRRCHELRVNDANQTWRVIHRTDPDAVLVVALFSKKKKARLEAMGGRVTSVEEWLDLTPEEVAVIDMKIRLGEEIRAQRRKRKLSQERVAKILSTNQGRQVNHGRAGAEHHVLGLAPEPEPPVTAPAGVLLAHHLSPVREERPVRGDLEATRPGGPGGPGDHPCGGHVVGHPLRGETDAVDHQVAPLDHSTGGLGVQGIGGGALDPVLREELFRALPPPGDGDDPLAGSRCSSAIAGSPPSSE